MATFYKYAERKAGDYVNWAEIGKNATDMITEEYKIRDEKKAAIDEEARELFLKLAEPPTGESESYSDKAIKFATVAQEQKLSDIRLLKSGKLDLQGYLSRSQNLLDGTGITFNLFKEYQDEYKVKMERINNADPENRSQLVEQTAIASVEGFGNLNAMDILVDPNTGKVNLGTKELDDITGVYKFKDILPVAQARARIKGKYNYFNSDAATTNIEKNLGESVQTLRKYGSSTRSGQLKKIEDKKELEIYEEAENKFIESVLTPLNTSSILTNDLNKGYYPVFTKEDAAKDSKAIYFKTDSNGLLTPEFTGDQKKDAFEYMQTTLRGKIDRKETIDIYGEQQKPRATPDEIKYANDRKSQIEAAGYWNEIASAPTLQKKLNALEKFMSTGGAFEAGLQGIDLESVPGSAVLTYDKPELNRTISFKTGTLDDWADKNEFTPLLGRSEKRRVGGQGTQVVDLGDAADSYKGVVAKRQGKATAPAPTSDPYSLLQDKLDSGVNSSIFKSGKKDAADSLKSILGNIATVVPSGSLNPDSYVTITMNGVSKDFDTNEDEEDASVQSSEMIDWVLKQFSSMRPERQSKLMGSAAP
jgi:hypothetical protein